MNRSLLDSGLPTAPYWSGVAGRDVSDKEAARLDKVDLGGWARTNADDARVRRGAEAGRGPARPAVQRSPRAGGRIRAGRLDAGFDHVFVSARLGMVKPDRAIFEHVLEELGARPEDVTFVDDRAANIEAAAELGIRSVLFTSVEELRAALA